MRRYSNITNYNCMFSDLSNIINIDFPKFDTSQVTNMLYMFNRCTKLELLDLTGFNTELVKVMNKMCFGCNKLKYIDYKAYSERLYTKLNTNINNCNVISNDHYTVCTKENGEGFSMYKNILVNHYKETDDYAQGIIFYIKNIKSRKVWTSSPLAPFVKPENFKICFTPDSSKFIRKLLTDLVTWSDCMYISFNSMPTGRNSSSSRNLLLTARPILTTLPPSTVEIPIASAGRLLNFSLKLCGSI